jgi:hypothetical protein
MFRICWVCSQRPGKGAGCKPSNGKAVVNELGSDNAIRTV